jgi:hypothetical protein
MRNKQLLLFILIPLTTYASGSEVILIFWYELFAIIISMFFIFTLKWKIKHKLILIIIYFISLIYTNIIFGSMHYNYNLHFVSTLLAVIPISILFTTYLIIRKKYWTCNKKVDKKLSNICKRC